MTTPISHLLSQARALRGQDDHRAAILFEQAVAAARAQNDAVGLADALNALAGLEHTHGGSQGALLHLEEALALRETAQDREGTAVVLCNLGAVHLDLGSLNTALDYMLRAEAAAVEATPARGAMVAGNLARTYDALNLIPEALFHSTRALELTQAAGLVTTEVAVCINHADLLRRHGDFTQAGQLLERALTLAADQRGLAASAYQGLGQLRQDEGRYPEALQAFLEALQLAEEYQDLDEILEARCSAGGTLLSLGRSREALALLSAAAETAQVGGRTRTSARALALQAQAAEMEGDLVEALALQRRAQVVETEVLRAEAERRTRELAARGELEKARAQLEREQARYEAEHQAKEKLAQEQAARLQELERLALYDALTGLPNRLLLSERVRAALERAAAQGEQVAIGVLDLNKFKAVNDTHGHHVGDLLLRGVAERLTGALGPHHTVARTGGDEFVVLLPGTVAPTLPEVAHHILQAFEEPFFLNSVELNMRPSLGLARYPDDASDLAGLLEYADHAMYRAKARGSGFELGRLRSEVAPATLEAALHGALRSGEMHLEYQPLEDASGRWIAAEALLRWRSPVYGNVTPHQFMPLAERSGLSLPLGEWTLRHACTQLTRLPGLTLAVNVSARQLTDPNLPEQIRHSLQDAGVEPGRLALEVREEVVAHAPERSRQALGELRATGVRLTLDDFGGGFAHFAGLTELPVHAVKLDRTLIHGLDQGPRGVALVQAVVQLARALELEVIAKGVETVTQRAQLQHLGVNSLQGFLISAPLEPEALIRQAAASWRRDA